MVTLNLFRPTPHADTYLKTGFLRCNAIPDGDYALRATEIEKVLAEYHCRKQLQKSELPLYDERILDIEREYFAQLFRTVDHARCLLVGGRDATLEAVFEVSVDKSSVVDMTFGCPGGNPLFPVLGVPLEVNLRDRLVSIHVEKKDVRQAERMAATYRFNVPVLPFPPAPTKFLVWDVPTE